MSSRRRSIIKFLPEARNSSAFSVEIYIKDFTREIICESLKYFLRSNPHKNPRNTRRTRILVKDYSKDFYLDFEPVRRSIIKRSYRATYCCAFWYEIFVKDSRGVTNFKPQTSDFIFALQALQYNNITVSKNEFFALQSLQLTVLQFLKRKNRCV